MLFLYMPWRLRSHVFAFFLALKRVNFSRSPQVEGFPPQINNRGDMSIGERCLFRTARLRTRLTTYRDAKLSIGKNAYINDGVSICATRYIAIGDFVKIGDMTTILDSDFHQVSPATPVKQEPVFIGHNVWIGSRVFILPGATIGDHSVIATGSIVNGNIPSKSLAAGVPARVIKTLDIPESWIRD